VFEDLLFAQRIKREMTYYICNGKVQDTTENNRTLIPFIPCPGRVDARLGGWTKDDKSRPPGVITLKRGLDRFNLIFIGWKINYMKLDVSSRLPPSKIPDFGLFSLKNVID